MRRPFSPIPLVLFALLVDPAAHAQMEVDELIITSGPSVIDGVFTDYFTDPVIFGFEIAAVSVTTQSGVTVDFVEIDDDEFGCDEAGIPGDPCEGFASLADLNALGDLTFSLLGESGEVDSIFVPAADWIPGAGQPGVPMLTSPAPGDSSLPPGNLFQWSPPPVWVDAIVVDMVDVLLDQGIDEDLFLGNTQTSWAPTGVNPTRLHAFELSFVDTFFVSDLRTTPGGRPYLFTSGFEAFSRKFVPEPSGALVWLSGVGAVAAFGRRRRA
ncbi:MAG: PEP-CTERM sorting domain-containing protein [Myxococcota bacterium]